AAKENPRTQRLPVSQSPGRCQIETTRAKFPHSVKPRSLPRKNPWQTRAFFAPSSLPSTPGTRGTSAARRKRALLLSFKKEEKKKGRPQGAAVFSGLPFLSTQTPGRSGRPG